MHWPFKIHVPLKCCRILPCIFYVLLLVNLIKEDHFWMDFFKEEVKLNMLSVCFDVHLFSLVDLLVWLCVGTVC